jgi:hypothetical protein
MIKLVRRNDGIALVTSLMLTLITLVIIMSVMYLITQSVSRSGMAKRYKNTVEAAYGGTDVVMKDIIPYILRNYSSSNIPDRLASNFGGITLTSTTQACLKAKISSSSNSWPAGCNNSIEAKQSPDFTFNLQASAGQPFAVYSKIIDTVVGNSDVSGLQLEGGGVAESSSVITPQHFPYVYRVEIQGERATNATERTKMSVLYAY